MIPSRPLVRATIVAAIVSFAFAPGRVHAGPGVNLAWNHCLGEGTGVQNASFACDVNTGSQTIVASLILPADLRTVGFDAVLAVASSSPVLPEWWALRGTGFCRSGSLNVNMLEDPADVVCRDWSGGSAGGGLITFCYFGQDCSPPAQSANVAVLKATSFMNLGAFQDLSGGTEYFVFNFVITHQKTVGTGACGGCDIPTCIVFQHAFVSQFNTGVVYDLTAPTAPGTNFVTWQGGGAPSTGWGIGCPAATPTRKSTWGSVKSLYR